MLIRVTGFKRGREEEVTYLLGREVQILPPPRKKKACNAKRKNRDSPPADRVQDLERSHRLLCLCPRLPTVGQVIEVTTEPFGPMRAMRKWSSIQVQDR